MLKAASVKPRGYNVKRGNLSVNWELLMRGWRMPILETVVRK
jgi:hypothetical protein